MCKKIYPEEEGLHNLLESKAWYPQTLLGELYTKYKNDFADRAAKENLTELELMTAIHNLRIASQLQVMSKTFE